MNFKKIDELSQQETLRQAQLFASGNINVYLYCLTVLFNKLNEIIKEMNNRREALIKMQTQNEKTNKLVVEKLDTLSKMLNM